MLWVCGAHLLLVELTGLPLDVELLLRPPKPALSTACESTIPSGKDGCMHLLVLLVLLILVVVTQQAGFLRLEPPGAGHWLVMIAGIVWCPLSRSGTPCKTLSLGIFVTECGARCFLFLILLVLVGGSR